jgi:hypothetical protein
LGRENKKGKKINNKWKKKLKGGPHKNLQKVPTS